MGTAPSKNYKFVPARFYDISRGGYSSNPENLGVQDQLHYGKPVMYHSKRVLKREGKLIFIGHGKGILSSEYTGLY